MACFDDPKFNVAPLPQMHFTGFAYPISSRGLFVSDSPEAFPLATLGQQVLARATFQSANGIVKVRVFLWHQRDSDVTETTTVKLYAKVSTGSGTITQHVSTSDYRTRDNQYFAWSGKCLAWRQLAHALSSNTTSPPGTTLSTSMKTIGQYPMPYSTTASSDSFFFGAIHEIDVTLSPGSSLLLWTGVTSSAHPTDVDYNGTLAKPSALPPPNDHHYVNVRGGWDSCEIEADCLDLLALPIEFILPSNKNPARAVQYGYQNCPEAAWFPSSSETPYPEKLQNKGLYGVTLLLLGKVFNPNPVTIPVDIATGNDATLYCGAAMPSTYIGFPFQVGILRSQQQQNLVDSLGTLSPYSTSSLYTDVAVGGGSETPGDIRFGTIAYTNPTITHPGGGPA